MFIRKRDPRYKSHLAKQATAAQTPLSNTPLKSNTPARLSTPVFVEQDWQKPSSSDIHHDADLEWAAAEGDSDSEEWECVACNKTFRSEAAWDSHERSRKHMQAVERLKQQMLEEDDTLDLGDEEIFYEAESEVATSVDPPIIEGKEDGDDDTRSRKKAKAKGKQQTTSRAASPSPARKSERKGKGRRKRPPSPDKVPEPPLDEVDPEPNDSTVIEEPDTTTTKGPTTVPAEMTKREKRRAKEAAKKAQAAEASTAKVVCIHVDNNTALTQWCNCRCAMYVRKRLKARRNCLRISMRAGMR